MDEARKRISDISDFSVKLSEVLDFLVKDNLEFKNTVKKDNDTLKGKIHQFNKNNICVICNMYLKF